MAESNNTDDPYGFILELAYISPSQEEILRNAPFVGPQPHTHYSHHMPSSSAFVDIPPDSHDAARDVFHTPPEEADDQPSETPAGLDPCAVNHAVHLDAGSQAELGFSEVQLTDVHECSHAAPGDVLGDIPNGQFDESVDFERPKLSDLGEPPVKKPKLSEHDLGGNTGNQENEISMNKKLQTLVGVVQASGMRKKSDEEPRLRVLPPSIRGCLDNAASEMECGNGPEKINVFDVLRVLSEYSDDAEENLDHRSLLDVAKARGVTFPRPRWWPEGDNFEP